MLVATPLMNLSNVGNVLGKLAPSARSMALPLAIGARLNKQAPWSLPRLLPRGRRMYHESAQGGRSRPRSRAQDFPHAMAALAESQVSLSRQWQARTSIPCARTNGTPPL